MTGQELTTGRRAEPVVAQENRPIAVCRCGAPLLSTFTFPGVEWYCVECGNKLGWWMEDRAEWTQELADKHAALLAEAKPFLTAIITFGSRLTNCDRCNTAGLGDHNKHATEEEWAASTAAHAALRARAGLPPLQAALPPPESASELSSAPSVPVSSNDPDQSTTGDERDGARPSGGKQR